MSVQPFAAVIFDMDGVVTDTASVHAAAWKETFDPILARHGQAPFDADAEYRRYVDGRSREDGVTTFLAARGIAPPAGGPGDSDDEDTVQGVAARKHGLFAEKVRRGVRAFPGTVNLLRRLRQVSVRTALVSASRDAGDVLAAAGVADLFDVRVDGTDAVALHLPGKPDPALFLEAARRLGVAPAVSVVVEDAIAGVEAGRRGGFGLVVGVDRLGHHRELAAAGADIVVADVGELDLGAIRSDPWVLAYQGFDPVHEGHREALTTLGNGYFATRGAAPESHADGVHYPGTYLAGVYNRLVSTVAGEEVETEHLVNAPNWLPLDLAVDGGGWWSEGGLDVMEERRRMDIRGAVLTREVRLIDPAGRQLVVTQRRLVSMARSHLAALETTVVAEGWSGRLSVRSGIDGGVVNANVAEDRLLANRHLVPLASRETAHDTVLLEVETSQSRVRIACAARTRVSAELLGRRFHQVKGAVAHEVEAVVRDGQ
ncbi:MAG TPA: beta-phosphoglucomutase family hydrolase, partial [Acidimicrobiales bacterium]|nr:beta-phosphoglucomutase family hydrolase [Acidimicrobiales bacterium]